MEGPAAEPEKSGTPAAQPVETSHSAFITRSSEDPVEAEVPAAEPKEPGSSAALSGAGARRAWAGLAGRSSVPKMSLLHRVSLRHQQWPGHLEPKDGPRLDRLRATKELGSLAGFPEVFLSLINKSHNFI